MIKTHLLAFVILSTAVLPAYAQEAAIQAPPQTNIVVPETPAANSADEAVPAVVTPMEKEINEQIDYLKPSVDVNAMKSLFFSIWEHDLVRDARRGLNTRMDMSDDGVEHTGPRDISLSGIVYTSKTDWVIWLNNVRISPTRIPTEVMDLKVFKDYIELEWFDKQTNQIYPIRLRPQQRFNLDTRMFLPG